MKVKKSKINLKMDFDARDVIDILVSEQEQNIENQIANCRMNKRRIKKELVESVKTIETYTTKLVKEKYDDKFGMLDRIFKEIDLNASVRFEIIDGSAMPHSNNRSILISNPQQQYKENYNRIIVALIICNKSFDRNMVDNTVSFYLEIQYDDELISLNKTNKEIEKNLNNINDKIREFQKQLDGTDRLVRRARAAVTKKAVGTDIDELLADFRQQFPQVGLKNDDKQIDLKEKYEVEIEVKENDKTI